VVGYLYLSGAVLPAHADGYARGPDLLSDLLLEAYCALRNTSEARRYKLMGALMVAQDQVGDEVPGPPTKREEQT
jgi:hypothetical protein